LVTGADQPTLAADDRVLLQALTAAGVPARVAVWTDPEVDWARASACVVRSVWDYHLHPARFRAWVAAVGQVSTLLNPPALMTWNMHKRYLSHFAAQGVPTIDTVWLTPGSRVDLAGLLTERGWREALVKPAVSASAWRTAKVNAWHRAGQHGTASGQRLVEEILEQTDALVQPYLPSIERDGEISVIAVAGELTHAARRASALTSDIEDTRRGSAHSLSEKERGLAAEVLALLPTVPLYARVDLVRDERGRLLLGELELIEPALYLRHSRRAVQRLVTELARHASTRVGQRQPQPDRRGLTPQIHR